MTLRDARRSVQGIAGRGLGGGSPHLGASAVTEAYPMAGAMERLRRSFPEGIG
jgi:hypothetical protein